MKHPSKYLDWYIHVPEVRYDFRSSGIANFRLKLDLGEVDLSTNYAHGNPKTTEKLADWFKVKPDNIFISSEGASGQNARIIRYIAERNPEKTEAIVEYPTYEPLLRQVQEHFRHVKRLERHKKDAYALDAEQLRKVASEKTCLLAITNPHAPSGAISARGELIEIMNVAGEHGFCVLCDEVYAEFDRNAVPTLFSISPRLSIVTTSFTKAYGLGGLKLGVALCERHVVDDLYKDVLNTVGNSPNIVQVIAAELFGSSRDCLERHKQKWSSLKRDAEDWLSQKGLEYFPSKVGVTYWVSLPVKDTYRWVNECTIPRYKMALVPGAFFLFKDGYELQTSNMVRLGLGNLDPEEASLTEALQVLGKAISE